MIQSLDKNLQESLSSLKEESEQELIRILGFWEGEVHQPDTGSFIGRIDQQGNKYPDADLGAVLITRILWTFSAVFKRDPQERYKIVADAAFNMVVNYFWDAEFGGLFWSVDHKGQVSNTRKQAYAQGFGIYGLSEYFSAFGNSEALDMARSLRAILEDKFYEPEFGGYLEALDRDWSEIEDLRLSDKDANAPKSMNTHLHILEPYSNLYRIDPTPELKERLESLTRLFLDKIIHPETGHFDLFFSRDWSRLSTIHSYGHDIEGAWLLREAAELIGDPDLTERVEHTSERLVRITLDEGTDTDGSLFYEREDGVLDKDKHWWPQAEAMVGCLDAFEISGNSMYLVQCLRVWNFIKINLIDNKNGDWFWRISKDGKPLETDDKAGFWKCPYHNSRALMEVIRRIEQITKNYD
ncbi:MAG: AGE family epimerase/isomerase [Lutimonas sp.]